MRGLGVQLWAWQARRKGVLAGSPTHSSCKQPSRQKSLRKLGGAGDRVQGTGVALKGGHIVRCHSAWALLDFWGQTAGAQEACAPPGRPLQRWVFGCPLRRSRRERCQLQLSPGPRGWPLAPGPACMGRERLAESEVGADPIPPHGAGHSQTEMPGAPPAAPSTLPLSTTHERGKAAGRRGGSRGRGGGGPPGSVCLWLGSC